MKQFDVGGMMCAACSARVEKVVSEVPGVTSCSVSLLTNSMGVEGTASDEEIIKAVVDAGYEASVKAEAGAGAAGSSTNTKTDSTTSDPLTDKETPLLKKRLITSLIFLLRAAVRFPSWTVPLQRFLVTSARPLSFLASRRLWRLRSHFRLSQLQCGGRGIRFALIRARLTASFLRRLFRGLETFSFLRQNLPWLKSFPSNLQQRVILRVRHSLHPLCALPSPAQSMTSSRLSRSVRKSTGSSTTR